MFESIRSVDDVIKFVAAYDETGESSSKIDTKKEYDVLGKYLNGSSFRNLDKNGNEDIMNYADLSSKDKKVLFDLMDGLKSKFGEWKNVFSPDADVDEQTIHLYLERYREFQTRLNKFEEESKREEYFNEIKQELNLVETKIKNYCSKLGFSAHLDISTVDDLHKILDNLKYETQVKEFLKNNNEGFKITEENAEEYVYMADYLFHNSTAPAILSKDEYDKAADIMRTEFARFLSQFSDLITPDNIHQIDVIDAVNQITEVMKQINKKQNPQLEAVAKEFLMNFEDKYRVITEENAEEYAGMFRYIVEELDHSKLSDEEKAKYNTLKQAYTKFLHSWEEAINSDNIEDCNITLCVTLAVDYFNRMANLKKCGEKVNKVITNPYDNKKLQAKVQQYIKENKIPKSKKVPDDVDIGNGLFDKISTQKADNCWIHSGINSLLVSKQGKQLVQSNYYRDSETGVIAVHLQEAEDAGLHGGIYFVTPQEIIDSKDRFASGEGDVTAYIIAIQKYFDEINSNPELKEKYEEEKLFTDVNEGNYCCRFYELVTGGNFTTFRENDKDESKLQPGIGRGRTFNSNKLYDMIANQKGAISIALEAAEHAISVVGVKDGNFIVQESNNEEDFFKRFRDEAGKEIFTKTESINGRPTYTIPKEYLEIYNLGVVDYIMWE